jgi:hypothetical protein|tara:strand:- start:216 stop:518 length:303 start_codon:yes stop_codon:yes gene_type:complete
MVRKSSGSSVKYVEVEWRDIISTAGWERSEDTKLPIFWSYGYLINHDDDEVRIATTKDEKGEWFGFTVIPPGCVKKISPLIKGGNRDQLKRKTIKPASKI